MLIDARTLADGAEITADVCIVGAGAAGITLALELRNSGLAVALLAGGLEKPGDAYQNLYRGRMTGIDTWDLHRMRVRAFGGTTHHWGGWCRPLSPEDFERRAWMPGSGWPVTYAEMVPYYRRAQETVQIGGFSYDPVAVADALGMPILGFDPDVVETRFYQYSPPTRFGTVYRQAIASAPDVRAYLDAHLTEIVLDGPRARVSHLACRTLGGTRFTVTAARHVLALGGLENPRMLLASNRQLPEGVANRSGQVGRWFMEHPHYYSAPAMIVDARNDLRFYRAVHDVDVEARPTRVRAGIALSAAVRAAEKLPNFTCTLDTGDATGATGSVAPGVADGLLARRGSHVVRLSARTEQTPDPDSAVTLGEGVDALGLPRLELHWSVRDEDDRALRRAFEIVAAELGRASLGRLWVPTEDGRFSWDPQPGGHHMGTTRMDTSPDRGVVDADSRCHDVANLYLAGGSVFPTGGDANPTLTIVALAHRLADHLKTGGAR